MNKPLNSFFFFTNVHCEKGEVFILEVLMKVFQGRQLLPAPASQRCPEADENNVPLVLTEPGLVSLQCTE
jgi:hypothetical protein